MEKASPGRKGQNYYYIHGEGAKGSRQSKIDAAEYERLLEEQNGVCAICGQPESSFNSSALSIDHCHKTGRVRGLLCSKCNRGLGFFEDSEELLESALRYLRQERAREVEVLPVGYANISRTRPSIVHMDGETYYSTSEACSYLGATRDTLNRMKKDGRLHQCRQGYARRVYYRRSELDALKVIRRVDD